MERNDYPIVPKKYRVERIHPKKPEEYKAKKFTIPSWLIVIILIFLAYGIFGLLRQPPITTEHYNTNQNVLPKLEEPREKTFHWEYENKAYSITRTFHRSIFEYYSSLPKSYKCPKYNCQEWEEDYYRMFLEQAEGDTTIFDLISNIKEAGIGLSDDEIVEFTIAFIQAIPYDNEADLSSPRYPYQVLYENKGVCSGKTFLTILLVEELGYGIALFDYDPAIEDNAGHLVPAIKCLNKGSSLNPDYCYTEITTTGWEIGEIPEPKFFTDLGDVTFYLIEDGKSY